MTRLFFAKIHGDEPEYTAWSVERKFVFSENAYGWEMISQELLGDTPIPPMNEPTNRAGFPFARWVSHLVFINF